MHFFFYNFKAYFLPQPLTIGQAGQDTFESLPECRSLRLQQKLLPEWERGILILNKIIL